MYLLILLGPIFSVLTLSIFSTIVPLRVFFTSLFGSLFCSLILCCFAVYEVVYLNSFCLLEVTTWFKIGLFNVKWSFYYDKLGTLMLLLIIAISLLVHFFALDYLNEDPHLPRFLCY